MLRFPARALPMELLDLKAGLVSVGGQQVRSSRSLIDLNGHQIRLAIRHEELNAGHREGENNLAGRVDTITFLGPIVRLRVIVNESPLTMDIFSERRFQAPAAGEPFEISFHPDACWLL